MANLKSLAKDTAIYGLSSIVGRFLNYLLVPLYTHYMPKDSGDYGISTNVYAYTALILVLLTFGMETTLFRFANDERYKSDTVFSTTMAVVGHYGSRRFSDSRVPAAHFRFHRTYQWCAWLHRAP